MISFSCYFKLLFLFSCILMLLAFIFFDNFDKHRFQLISKINIKINKKTKFAHPTNPPHKSTTTALNLKNVRLNLLHSLKKHENLHNLTSSKVMEKLFENRTAHLRQMCNKIHFDGVQNIIFGSVNKSLCIPGRRYYGYSECLFTNNFHLARFSSSMICAINKVASTSIIGSILKASNLEAAGQSPHVTASVLNAETLEEFEFALKYFFKFIIVRHPMRRLLSAYMNKVEFPEEEEISLYKMREDLMLFLIKFETKHLNQDKINRENGSNRVAGTLIKNNGKFDVPTFEGFLTFILSFEIQGEGFDSHWVPFWKRCSPCSFNYDVILKLDSNYSELKYIWPALGYSSSDLPWSKKSKKEEEPEEKMLKKYYSSLSLNIIMKVYHAFLFDFKLFDYSICDVLILGDHCSDINCCHKIIYNYFPYLD